MRADKKKAKTVKKTEPKKKKKYRSTLGSGDFLLSIFTIALVIFGIIMVFSASYYYSISKTGNAYGYLLRHTAWAIVGLGAMTAGALVDYRKYKRIAPWVLIAGFVLLALVFTPLGHTANNATRWIKLGPITMMPGEIMKLCIILFSAWFLSEHPKRVYSFTRGIFPVMAVTGAAAFLIAKQPNLSTAITVCGIAVGMLLVAGMKWRYLAGLGGIGAGGILFILLFMKGDYRYDRLTIFMDPFRDHLGEGYQPCQSLMALGSGGLFGVGLGKSVQKNLYLPEPQNDYILSIIGEELGFIGIMAVLAVYCCFLWRGVHIAINAPDRFGMMLASGIVLMVGIQVILNVAVVTSSMPPTGINLPFISYGGNALLIFMFSAGVLLNISRHENKREKTGE